MPPPRPLNPTIFVILVVLVWGVLGFVLPGPWWLAWLVAAVLVHVLLRAHRIWDRRRKARAQDATRPYSREENAT